MPSDENANVGNGWISYYETLVTTSIDLYAVHDPFQSEKNAHPYIKIYNDSF